MDFVLNESQRLLTNSARAFALRSVQPQSAEIDRSAVLPQTLIAEMGALGFYGLPFPPQEGGGDMGFLGLILATEQISRSSMAVGVGVALAASVGQVVARFGTATQRHRFLPTLVTGERLPFWAFTEPATGSDPKAIESRAQTTCQGYVLEGQKLFVSLAPVAQWGIVFAKGEDALISAFLIERSSPGLHVGELHDIMGARGLGASTLYLDQIPVSHSSLLGKLGDGYRVLLEGASLERLAFAAGCLGVSQEALDLSVAYAKQRTAYGAPIADMQSIQALLADMHCNLEAGRWLTYRTASLRDQGDPVTVETAEAKLFASQAGVEITRKALQVHGAYGTERTLPIERLYRDAKMAEVIVGVSEIQRTIIARSLLQ